MAAPSCVSADLDPHVIPHHYCVELAPTPSLTTGKVRIDLELRPGFASRSLPIHADQSITIHEAHLLYTDESADTRKVCVRPFCQKQTPKH